MNTLWRGLRLRCPHCGKGSISRGFLRRHARCQVCAVRFERKAGETAGASIVWLAVLPIISMLFYFALYASSPHLPLPAQLGITAAFTLILGLLGYRHVCGLWIAFVELSEGLQADSPTETPEQ